MKRITKIALFALGLAGLAVLGWPALVTAAGDNSSTFDIACDCRTGAILDGGVRGGPFIIQGKMFPAGTLPSGTASNDPTQPVNGVAAIGDWICRGQAASSPALPPAYASTPAEFFTQYFILKNGTITTECYEGSAGHAGQCAVTGGVNGFSGASGDTVTQPLGTNITGCPNFRVTFRFQPGSLR